MTSINYTSGGLARTFTLFDTVISRTECEKILRGKSYPIAIGAELVRTVVDIGANAGAATVHFASHYPAARILSFEPDPATFELLRVNTHDFANVSVFNYGISDRDTYARLFLGTIDPATNSLQHSSLNSAESVEVSLKEPLSVLAENGVEVIDILKLDTEGSELLILNALGPLLFRTRLIYLEYHSEDDRLAIDQLLTGTHILCSGNILCLHRGELCYILRDLLPEEHQRLKITSRG